VAFGSPGVSTLFQVGDEFLLATDWKHCAVPSRLYRMTRTRTKNRPTMIPRSTSLPRVGRTATEAEEVKSSRAADALRAALGLSVQGQVDAGTAVDTNGATTGQAGKVRRLFLWSFVEDHVPILLDRWLTVPSLWMNVLPDGFIALGFPAKNAI
jgi:hypothetical protein